MNFFEFRFNPVSDDTLSAMITAFLMELGFESFSEEENELIAYLPGALYNEGFMEGSGFRSRFPGVSFTVLPLEDKNWNEEWEKNYQPVVIAGRCYVRAPFHDPRPEMAYEIVIEPKMAFGTAHHETTRLMAGWLMDLQVKGNKVLDMGCGTGILAILANKMGASFVTGIDNDEWAWRNAMENFTLNGVGTGEVILGDAGDIVPDSYHLVLANINRNILVRDMAAYASSLKNGGELLLSGFYETDRNPIMESARHACLSFSGIRTLNHWAVMLFIK